MSDDSRSEPSISARAYLLDDGDVREQLDRLARLSARICEAPIALVTLVLEDTQRFVGKSGVDLDGTPRANSFCAHAMAHRGMMIVPDARADPRFANNPLVTGSPHIRFYAGQPLVSPEGVPLGSFCVIDTRSRSGLSADQAEAMETLAEAAMALLEKWRQATEHRRHSAATRMRLADMEQRFDVLADALPQLVWSSPADGMPDYFSAQWCKFTGRPAEASYGTAWMGFLHPDEAEETRAAWNEAVASGSSYAVNYRLRRHDGEYVWMLARGLPIRDESGKVERWIGTCTDIQGQVQASELLEMMSHELSHRIKNLFAVTQGLISMSMRNQPALKELAGEMQSRLRALGRAHDLVRPRFVSPQFASSVGGHPDPSLRELLQTLLMPYAAGDTPRWQITGDDVVVGEQAATPLALFVHEIGTNSVKYGALSAEGGSVEIHVSCASGAGSGEQISFEWRERGGPPVIEPERRGFGYRLAELSIVRQLGGVLEFKWQPEGLVITAKLPLTSLTGRVRPNVAASAVPNHAA